MNSDERRVAGIWLRTDGPTDVSDADLYSWVVWQFPRRKGAALCGAVHPPLAGHSWLPALIRHGGRVISVYGHLSADFASPNEAADWLMSQHDM